MSYVFQSSFSKASHVIFHKYIIDGATA